MTHFCVYFYVCFGLLSWWKIQTWPIIIFLAEAVRFRFFICWYLIESWCHLSEQDVQDLWQKKQAHNIKDPAEYLTVDMGYFFIPVCTKLIWWVCCQKAMFFFQFHLTMEASANWSSSRVWQLNMLEFVFGWVRRIFLETLPNNMWWCRGCLIYIFFRFLTPSLN